MGSNNVSVIPYLGSVGRGVGYEDLRHDKSESTLNTSIITYKGFRQGVLNRVVVSLIELFREKGYRRKSMMV